MATAQVDVPFISSYLAFPEQALSSLLSLSPTQDLITALLENIALKAREHQRITSEHVKLGIELESAVRAGEVKSKVLKNAADERQREVEDLRQQLETKGEASRISSYVFSRF